MIIGSVSASGNVDNNLSANSSDNMAVLKVDNSYQNDNMEINDECNVSDNFHYQKFNDKLSLNHENKGNLSSYKSIFKGLSHCIKKYKFW